MKKFVLTTDDKVRRRLRVIAEDSFLFFLTATLIGAGCWWLALHYRSWFVGTAAFAGIMTLWFIAAAVWLRWRTRKDKRWWRET